MICIRKGALGFISNGKERIILPGAALLLRRGSAFKLYTNRDKGYSGIHYSSYAEQETAFRGEATACLKTSAAVETMIALLEQEASTPQRGTKEILVHIGRSLALILARNSGKDKIAGNNTEDYARYWAIRTHEAIDANLCTNRGVAEIMEAIPLSYRQLARHFMHIYGYSPKQYQIEAKIREAKRLLLQTGFSITDIAYELGYPTTQHFSTQFAALAKQSPSEYRKRY